MRKFDDDYQEEFLREYNRRRMKERKSRMYRRHSFIRKAVKGILVASTVIVIGAIAVFVVMMLIGLREGLL